MKPALSNHVESFKLYRRAPGSFVFTAVKQEYICSPNTTIGRLVVKLKFSKNIYSEQLDNFIV